MGVGVVWPVWGGKGVWKTHRAEGCRGGGLIGPRSGMQWLRLATAKVQLCSVLGGGGGVQAGGNILCGSA